MMSHKRFLSLIDTYGADRRRWPEDQRSHAEELLRSSEPARAHLEAARLLDASLGDAARMSDAQLWGSGDQEAALARVRSLVGAAISSPSRPRNGIARLTSFLPAGGFFALTLCNRNLGLAVGCSLAVAVGLFVGSAQVSAPPSDNVIAVLQPALLQVVTD